MESEDGGTGNGEKITIPPQETPRETVPVWSWLEFLAILGIAAALRLTNLGTRSLWNDEGFTWHASQLSWRQLLTPFDVHPPLYYGLVKLLSTSAANETLLRLPSALTGIAGVAMVWWVGRRFGGAWCARAGALFLALSPAHLQFSQEARHYSLLTLEVAVAAGLLLQASVDRRWRWILGYGWVALLALYTHVIAAFYLLALSLAAGFLETSNRRSILPRLLLVQLAAGLLWLPWIVQLPLHPYTFGWLTHPGPLKAVADLLPLLGVEPESPLLAGLSAFRARGTARDILQVLIAVGWVGAALLGILGQSGLRRRLRSAPLEVVSSPTDPILPVVSRPDPTNQRLPETRHNLAAVSLAMGLAVGLIYCASLMRPLFITRTMLPSLLGVAWGVGLAVETLAGQARRAAQAGRTRQAALALLSIGVVGGWSAWRYQTGFEKSPWREAVARIAAEVEPGSALVVCPAYAFQVLSYYVDRDLPALPNYGWIDGNQENNSLSQLSTASLRAGFTQPLSAGGAREQIPMDTLETVAARHSSLWILIHPWCSTADSESLVLLGRLNALGYSTQVVDPNPKLKILHATHP